MMSKKQSIDIYDFFATCPDIAAPTSLKDLPKYAKTLEEIGQSDFAKTFMEWHSILSTHIEKEFTEVEFHA